ncbi:MFS transporter [Paenibacillus sp. BR2-3]|uniref:MFS transporter n=1 Tax=Paenibacillus sp. BR2-3 TaxID=3048494 RepID=UPI003977BE65
MVKKMHYGWIILILSCSALLSVQGVRSSFGAFVQPWENEFSALRGTISLMGSFSFIVYGFSQPIIGKLIDKWGIKNILSFSTLFVGIATILSSFTTSQWQLIVLYSVTSIGFGGASGIVASVAATLWFKKKKGLALGIINGGASAGQFFVVPASLLLIQMVGWRLTVILLGGVLLVIFPLLYIFLRDTPSDKGLTAYGEEEGKEEVTDQQNVIEKKTTLQLFQSKAFWFLSVPYFICGFTTTGLMDTHLIPYANDHGYSTQVTGAAISVLAACNLVGTILSGQIADRWNKKMFLGLLFMTRAVSIVLLLATNQTSLFFLFAILFGVVDYATFVPVQLIAAEHFKNHSMGYVFGLLALSHQLGAAFGAYIPGVIYDFTGSYYGSFAAAVISLIAATMMIVTLPVNQDVQVSCSS